MVLVGKVIALLLFLLVVPFLTGTLLTRHFNTDKDSLLLSWVSGFILMMGSAEILILAGTCFKVSFHVVYILFYVLCAAGSVLALVQNGQRILEMCKAGLRGLRGIPLIAVVACLLMLFQVGVYTFGIHEDADDAFYVATAATTVESDSIFQVNAYTGEPYKKLPSRYVLSPFPVYTAVLSRCSGIHPTIVAHTVLPAVLLTFAYAVYTLLGLRLFQGNKEKAAWLVFFTGLFLQYSAYSTSTPGSLTLLRIWQGKGLLAAALLPLLFYLFLRLLREQTKADYVLVFFTMLACCLATSMGIMLGAILLGCEALVLVGATKKPKLLLPLIVCAMPNLLLAVIYILIK